jgi:hypothetical protein
MSDRSPLFISAAESLLHAVELFRQVDDRKYTFIVLHLADAVELILQDRLIDAGESIHESGKLQKLTVWKVLDALRKLRVSLPERPMLELLLEDRQTIHYRPGRPELKTVYYYLDAVAAFFSRFVQDEYGIFLPDVLRELGIADADLQLLGVFEGQGNELAFLEALYALSPSSAVLQAYKFIESKCSELYFLQQGYLELKTRKPFLSAPQRSPEFEELLAKLLAGKFLTKKLINSLDKLRAARNYAVYRVSDGENPPDWPAVMEQAKAMIIGLNKAIQAETEEQEPADQVPEIG